GEEFRWWERMSFIGGVDLPGSDDAGQPQDIAVLTGDQGAQSLRLVDLAFCGILLPSAKPPTRQRQTRQLAFEGLLRQHRLRSEDQNQDADDELALWGLCQVV